MEYRSLPWLVNSRIQNLVILGQIVIFENGKLFIFHLKGVFVKKRKAGTTVDTNYVVFLDIRTKFTNLLSTLTSTLVIEVIEGADAKCTVYSKRTLTY